MDYNTLKDLIYTLQSEQLQQAEDDEEGDNKNISRRQRLARKLKGKMGRGKKKKQSSTSSSSSAKPDGGDVEMMSSSSQNKDLWPGMQNGNDNVQKDSMLKEETIELYELTSSPNKNTPEVRRTSVSSMSTMSSDEITPRETFLKQLEEERFKVDDFYKRTEIKYFNRFNSLNNDLVSQHIIKKNKNPFKNGINISETLDGAASFTSTIPTDLISHDTNNNETIEYDADEEEGEEEEEDVAEEDSLLKKNDNTALLNYSQFDIKTQKRAFLKKTIVNSYIDLCQLKSFIELNKLGFLKITKKFDKVLNYNIKQELILSDIFYKDTYTFQSETLATLNEKLLKLIEFYALITKQLSDIPRCKHELKSYLHDHIVWERSTTWKDMLGLESQELSQNLQNTTEADLMAEKLNLGYYKYPLPNFLQIDTKFLTIKNIAIPKLLFTIKAAKIAFIFVFTAILLGVKTFNDRVEGRCMALVECVALLWASEAIPLFATAFLVPLLTVLFKVLKNEDGTTMSGADASSTILASMWSSTIMILLAGFTLGEVLAKYDVARVLASWLLAAAGTKPRNVLLMAMGVVFFLSMWISNVAAPVLTYSLLSPLLDPLDASAPFARALVMGVALAANIGGLSSPISSPQNVISMQYLKPYGIGWGQFFAVALPVGIISLLLAWGLMCFTFKINTTKIEKFTPIRTKFSLKQWFIIVISVGTILLWCVESQIEVAFGSSGEIAILPIVLFFGTGLLTTNDLNTFPWSIVVLAMGGIALGKAVSSSGLLSTIAMALQKRIQNDGVMAILCIFGILMLVVGTFVSHTVSAIIIIPLVQEVGSKLEDPKAAPILVFGCALLASAGMGLASAGFPNVTAISMTDKKGNRYLNMMMFLTRGVPASLLVFVTVITVGYGIMHSVIHGTTGVTLSTASGGE